MGKTTIEIVCSACGEETPVKRETVYDGFKKTGERFVCAACGHVYPSEKDLPLKTGHKPSIFGDDDAPRKVNVFGEEEKGRNCRCCKHYLVNPFTQRCGLHLKEVQATDHCADFDRKPEPKEPGM
jgi:hypothetical protein